MIMNIWCYGGLLAWAVLVLLIVMFNYGAHKGDDDEN